MRYVRINISFYLLICLDEVLPSLAMTSAYIRMGYLVPTYKTAFIVYELQ